MKSKNLILPLFFGLYLSPIFSQEVEKSLFNVQVGTFGVWVNNELRLTNSLVLRTELGLENVVFNKTNFHSSDEFVLFPIVSLAPRYYYNRVKRAANGLDIFDNSGDFFSLAFRFYPEALVISKEKNITSNSYGYIISKWGIRRNINYHFSYEMGFGLGIDANTGEDDGKPFEVQPEVHLRIGYHFL